MCVILEVYAENFADFGHESFGASLFVVAVHIVAPVDFVDFAGGSAGSRYFEIARKGKHGGVASFLVDTDNHDGIGKLSAIVGTIAFTAFHIITASAES